MTKCSNDQPYMEVLTSLQFYQRVAFELSINATIQTLAATLLGKNKTQAALLGASSSLLFNIAHFVIHRLDKKFADYFHFQIIWVVLIPGIITAAAHSYWKKTPYLSWSNLSLTVAPLLMPIIHSYFLKILKGSPPKRTKCIYDKPYMEVLTSLQTYQCVALELSITATIQTLAATLLGKNKTQAALLGASSSLLFNIVHFVIHRLDKKPADDSPKYEALIPGIITAAAHSYWKKTPYLSWSNLSLTVAPILATNIHQRLIHRLWC